MFVVASMTDIEEKLKKGEDHFADWVPQDRIMDLVMMIDNRFSEYRYNLGIISKGAVCVVFKKK